MVNCPHGCIYVSALMHWAGQKLLVGVFLLGPLTGEWFNTAKELVEVYLPLPSAAVLPQQFSLLLTYWHCILHAS